MPSWTHGVKEHERAKSEGAAKNRHYKKSEKEPVSPQSPTSATVARTVLLHYLFLSQCMPAALTASKLCRTIEHVQPWGTMAVLQECTNSSDDPAGHQNFLSEHLQQIRLAIQ